VRHASTSSASINFGPSYHVSIGRGICIVIDVPLDRKISLDYPLNYRLTGEQNFFDELSNLRRKASALFRWSRPVAH
jgi:hypothetical protein